MGRTIGIDLGTTNSCVAVMEADRARVIENREGARTTPSVVAFAKDGKLLVGEVARRQAAVNAGRTVTSVKRQMGTNWKIRIDGKDRSAQEISALILMKLKKDAEEFLGEPVTDAVITVPAYFGDAERQATKDAGAIAGLNVRRIINEPTAAAMAFGLDHGEPQTVLVFDLGGGTFDVSIIRIGDNVIEVLSTAGDNHLGGDDWDHRLAGHFASEFYKQTKIRLEKDPTAFQRVLEEAEKCKKALSTAATYNVNLPFLAMGKDGPKHLELTVTRSLFEQLTDDLLRRTEKPVQNALADAGITADMLGHVLLVGGSTRMPSVAENVRRLLGKEPGRNVNPDEAVALGAAIQGGKLSFEVSGGSKAAAMVLLDVTPLSLSIETVGGVASRLIQRNSTIPTRHSQIFTTAAPFQRTVEIKVYQGERRFVRDNKFLGSFRLDGIRRAPAGVPQIEVTFDIDANGIVKVTARDLGTGRSQDITITGSTNMTEEEIRRAREDAARYENEDARRQELLDIRNEAEAFTYSLQKTLDELPKGSVDRSEEKNLRAELKNLEKLVAKAAPDRITDREAGEIKRAYEDLKAHAERVLR